MSTEVPFVNCKSILIHNENAYIISQGECFVLNHMSCSYKNSHSAIGRKVVLFLDDFLLNCNSPGLVFFDVLEAPTFQRQRQGSLWQSLPWPLPHSDDVKLWHTQTLSGEEYKMLMPIWRDADQFIYLFPSFFSPLLFYVTSFSQSLFYDLFWHAGSRHESTHESWHKAKYF